jgi:hypothetical protein
VGSGYNLCDPANGGVKEKAALKLCRVDCALALWSQKSWVQNMTGTVKLCDLRQVSELLTQFPTRKKSVYVRWGLVECC